MKKNFCKLLIVATLMIATLTAVIFADGEDKNGAVEILTAEDLMKISEDLDGKYVLGADIDLSSVNFTPIGSEDAPFSGELDGNGYKITVKNKAVFGALSGKVADLVLDGSITESVSSGDLAVLAQKAYGGAQIEDCENLATLSVTFTTARTSVAPFVANVIEGSVSISRCINRGEVSSSSKGAEDASVGGIVGYVSDTAKVSVHRCANYGYIKVDGGRVNVGGIVGQTSIGDPSTKAVITQCANKGNIDYYNLSDERAAGIIGYIKSGEIICCYNVGEIKAYSDSGNTPSRNGYGTTFGIFGYANLTSSSTLEVKGCYNASKDPLEADICVIRNADLGDFDNFYMKSREEYELSLMSSNVSSGEKGTEFTDANDLLAKISAKYGCYVADENGGYPTLAWENGGVIKNADNGLGLAFSFRQNSVNFDSHDVRVIVSVKDSFFDSQAKVTFRIEFNKEGSKIFEHTPILSKHGKEFKAYNSVFADGIEYKSEEGSTLFVTTVEQIPYEAWDKLCVYAEIDGEYQNLGNISYSRVYNHHDVKTFEELPGYRTDEATVSQKYNCGTMIGDDSSRLVGDESYMYVVDNTSANEFCAFVDRMKNNGFKVAQDRILGDVRTCTFEKNQDGSYYVVYYVDSLKQTRVIRESASSVLPTELSYDTNGGAIPVLYQYSLNYTGASIQYTDNRAINCGMLYIIKLPDNSLFVVDGGHGDQVSTTSMTGLYEFMKKISGTPDNEKIPIAGWFFTHAHGDHNGLAAEFLGYRYGALKTTATYGDKVDVKSVIFNYPSYQTMSSGYALTEVKVMKQAMRELFPNIKTLKVHTGQRFTLAGVDFDVLFTHEDMVDKNGKTTVSNFNNTSTVIKVSFKNGQTYMQLGDMDKAAAAVFNGMYPKDVYESDIVQISHHAINDLKSTYAKINAPIAVVPQSLKNAQGMKWDSFAPYSKDIYCADAYTFGFIMKDEGKIDVERHNHVG